MKIIILDAQTVTKGDLSLSPLDRFGEKVVYQLTPPELIAERVRDADMILCNKPVLCEENLKNAKNLKYIGLFATGYNNIDTEYTEKAGITVCNAGSYSTAAVAQQTFGFILNHFSKIADYDRFVKDGGWLSSETFSPFVFDTAELEGKTLGIVGYGKIGQQVARIANAFSMRVLVYKPTPMEDGSVTFTDLDGLLRESDVITLHCPLNERSKRMFNAEAFAKCKDGAYFINTARGGIVDEKALFDALESGKLSGAAVDVLTVEPMSRDCVLFGAKNITFSPHVAWAPLQTRERLMGIVCDNIEAFLNGKPKNVVK